MIEVSNFALQLSQGWSDLLDTDEVIEAAVEGYGNTGCGVSELGRFLAKMETFIVEMH